MLRTQVSPYTLIGHIADLPNPASVAQGMLFHADDTGECRILVIDPATGIRSWDEFCGISGITGIQGPAILAFAGSNRFVSAVYFIGNAPGLDDSVDVSAVSPAYPLARARTALNFNVNLRNRSTVSDAVTVDLLVNGAVALSVTIPASASHTGSGTAAGPASVPANAIINVRVTSPSAIRNTAVSATVELF